MRDINLVCAQQQAIKEAGETQTFHYKKKTVSKCTSIIVKRLEDQILERPRKKHKILGQHIVKKCGNLKVAANQYVKQRVHENNSAKKIV